MKKFFTFLLAILLVNIAYSQSFVDDVRKTNRVESQTRGILDIGGDIVSDNFFEAGTTMDLMFTINVNSADFEYADMVTMTFPAGVTPNTGSNPFPGNIDTGGPAEVLNAITGQVISWGDNDNSYGGITASGSYSFFVNVTIDAGFTGGMDVDYVVSGDEYAGSIHEFSGTVTVHALPTTPELGVMANGYLMEYYQVPLTQARFAPTGTVVNIGTELTDAVNFEVSVTGGYTDAQAISTPMATGDEQSFTFAEFEATEEGDHTFTFEADYANDSNPDNNVFVKDIAIDNVLARDNGEFNGNIGIGTAGGELGHLIDITVQDTLTSVIFKLDNTGNAGDEISVAVRSVQNGAPSTLIGSSLPLNINSNKTTYQAAIFPAVILAPGTYYIGLVEGANNVQLEHTTTPFEAGSAWAYFNDTWNDLGGLGFEHTYYLRGVFDDFVSVENDIELASINTLPIIDEQNVNMEGTIRNLSTVSTVTEFDVNYSVDGVEAGVYAVTGVSIVPGATYDFSHGTPFAANSGFHNISMTISSPNGNEDQDMTNNTLEKDLTVVNEIFTKVVVGEEATGTWCGWCTRGHVGLKDMDHLYPSDQWIGIAVHNNDPMADAEYDSNISSMVGGYPSGVINREAEVDPGDFEADFSVRMNEIPFGKVDVSSVVMDPATREVTIDASSTYALDLPNVNHRLSAIVVENDVTGTGNGWAQVNYYASNGLPLVDWEGIDWSTLGDPIPAADMVYDHVGRYIIGGWDGVAGSVPSSPLYNVANDYSFSTVLPNSIDENNVRIVVLLLDNTTGAVVNAAEKHLQVGTSTVNIGDPNEIKIFPNPASDNIIVTAKAGSQVTIYDLHGKLVYNSDMKEVSKDINLNSFESGSYILRVLNNNTTYSKKFVVIQ